MRWSRPEQAVVLLAVVAAVAGGGALLALKRPAAPIRVIEPQPATALVVQVDGEVHRPGLYQLVRGARVGDAIQAAGGMTPGADAGAVNLARPVRDGERLTIPARGASSGSTARRRVNVNAGTTEELEALPGIGPVLARRIVDHRARHGPFQRLEDLLQIEGIGPKLLEKIRPLITVD